VTERLFLRDATLLQVEATVTAVDATAPERPAVALDRTVAYPTGGGQPHDTGTLSWHGGQARIVEVRSRGDDVWHHLDGPAPTVGAAVVVAVDRDRRHALMRTHTAMHILCGVIWNEWGVAVTGGNMEPLEARMDFEFDPLPEGFGPRVEELVNAEIAADRPIAVTFLPRPVALADDALIRTKVNLIPDTVQEIRVVDIVGLDRQADGGTHVASTAAVGRVEVVRTESKGKGNKRVRVRIH
jgi:misacylated tRNA(Ala) deacylase